MHKTTVVENNILNIVYREKTWTVSWARRPGRRCCVEGRPESSQAPTAGPPTPRWATDCHRSSEIEAAAAAASNLTSGQRLASHQSNCSTHSPTYSTEQAYPFDAHCCHTGTAIKHPASDRPGSFVIFDIRALWRSALSVRVTGCQKWLKILSFYMIMTLPKTATNVDLRHTCVQLTEVFNTEVLLRRCVISMETFNYATNLDGSVV